MSAVKPFCVLSGIIILTLNKLTVSIKKAKTLPHEELYSSHHWPHWDSLRYCVQIYEAFYREHIL